MGKVHGSLARAGKVKQATPKVEKQEKKKTPKGRASECDSFVTSPVRYEGLAADVNGGRETGTWKDGAITRANRRLRDKQDSANPQRSASSTTVASSTSPSRPEERERCERSLYSRGCFACPSFAPSPLVARKALARPTHPDDPYKHSSLRQIMIDTLSQISLSLLSDLYPPWIRVQEEGETLTKRNAQPAGKSG